MTFFKNLFKDKDKKTVVNLVTLLASGVLLLVLSVTIFNSDKDNKEQQSANIQSASTSSGGTVSEEFFEESKDQYEATLEKRLQEMLSYVDGAGDVQVMITLSFSTELVVASNGKLDESSTTETDGEGGSRDVHTKKLDEETVMVKAKDGSETPLILKEINPKVEGVLIIAKGGGDIMVKDALIRAAQTVLGVEPHKVQVLKMK